jgi:dTDP-4-dehydrorhamnose 3,5-epimerase
MATAATLSRTGFDVSNAADLPRRIRPKRFDDNRGWFSETWSEKLLRNTGIACRFLQDNQSYSRKAGTLRGLHFQRPPYEQAKLVSVLHGRILDVLVDIRFGSPTYGRYIAVELTAEDGGQLYVPIGYAHGFCTLEDDVHVAYKVSNIYEPTCDDGLRFDDRQIGVKWPFSNAELTVSPKDRNLPFLRDFKTPFAYDGQPMRLCCEEEPSA